MSGGYRLESLLALRRREEDAAKEALAAALAAFAAAEQRLLEAMRELAGCGEALRVAQGQLTDPVVRRAAERESMERFVARRRAELEAAQGQCAVAESARRTAEQGVTAARDGLRTRAREREAVEKHRQRWLTAQRQEAARREEKTLDELASRRGPAGQGGT